MARHSSKEQESAPRDVEYFVALDMDGTLLKSHKLTPLIIGYFIHDDAQAQEAVDYILKQRGKDFDSFSYLASLSGMDQDKLDLTAMVYGLIEQYGVNELRSRLLMPGADVVSHTLRSRDIPHGILTKGGEIFQSFKLTLLRTLVDEPDFPALITSVEAKSRFIEEEWWDEKRQRFVIPAQLSPGRRLQSKNIVMLDDKLGHLVSKHVNIHGYHIDALTIEDFIIAIEENGMNLAIFHNT